jgi:protein-L-isoaspartate(D-aspartate) O-methyltransferase
MSDLTAARQNMVASQLRARGISDQRVLEAMLRAPREEFVPQDYRKHAYDDNPLPIGNGQTISQPYVVAVMLEALHLSGMEKVLEIGTGSGYVAALLAQLAAQVFSIERHSDLADNARQVLARLGYSNVRVITADGTQGLPDSAPFDAIMVSAAAFAMPPALFEQLTEGGGRMVIPIGTSEAQQLQLIRKIGGWPVISLRGAVRFVPLISEA